MIKRILPLALASALVAFSLPAEAALPHAGTLEPEQMPTGPSNLSFGLQSVGGHGLVASIGAQSINELFEMNARIQAPPASFLGFFDTDANVCFVGQTGAFLPVNLMPMMGIGASFLMQDVPNGTATDTDINIDLYAPVGLRYVLNLGALTLGAQALYHFTALPLWKGKADLNHWRFEVDAKTGKLFAGAFYDMGTVFNGPGARVGLAF